MRRGKFIAQKWFTDNIPWFTCGSVVCSFSLPGISLKGWLLFISIKVEQIIVQSSGVFFFLFYPVGHKCYILFVLMMSWYLPSILYLIPLPLFIRFELIFRLGCVSVLVLSMSRLSCLADSFWPTKQSLNRSTLPSRFSHGQPRLARVGPGVRLRLNVERNVLLGITSFLQASPSLNMVPAQPLLMDIDHPAPVYLFNIPLIYYNLAPVVSPLQFVVRILP